MRPVPGRFYRQGANAINQGDVVLTAEQPQWLKVALTYAVPFFVFSSERTAPRVCKGNAWGGTRCWPSSEAARATYSELAAGQLAPDQFATAPGNSAHSADCQRTSHGSNPAQIGSAQPGPLLSEQQSWQRD